MAQTSKQTHGLNWPSGADSVKMCLKLSSLIYSCFKAFWCLVTKIKIKVMQNLLSKSGLRYLIGFIVEASDSATDCKKFQVFGTIFAIFF